MLLRAISAVLVCAVLEAGCSTPQFGLEPRFSPARISGTFATTGGSGNSSVDLGDLGLNDNEFQAGGRVDVKWGSPHLTASYTPSSFDGDSVLSSPITVGGTTISAGTSVHSDVTLDVSSAEMTFDLLPVPDVELGLGLGVGYVDFRTKVHDTSGGNSIDTSEKEPIPLLAGRVGWDIWRFRAEVLATGFGYSSGGTSLDYYDVDADVRFNFIGHDSRLKGWISAGYRQIGADLAYDDSGSRIKSDVTLKGPFVGVVLGF
jgi:hypothetical protein